MARWRLAFVGVAATLPLLASCGIAPPPGTDGDLSNGWSAMAAPTAYEPKVGTCMLSLRKNEINRNQDVVTDCVQVHDFQVVGGGTIDLGGASVTTKDALYAQCDKMATDLIGEDWRNGQLDIEVVLPKSASTEGGARWWECDVFTSSWNADRRTWGGDVTKGIPDDLRLRCFRATDEGETLSDVHVGDCALPHNAEYAGATVLPARTPFPESDDQWQRIWKECREVVARYVGVTPSNVRNYYASLMRDKDTWSNLRDVRCFVYTPNGMMTKSAKGTQGKGLPW